ncbi:MAG: prepilin-type N-terminal cleavage/methylation domain-containing protein [Planctomycetales bacterium]|nr:prepilin-type N-terminal cleavage/methylation domain-containing protein [Planctomycetales bacterium]
MENGKWKLTRSGLSLTEILVVVGIMAVLMAISIPAARGLINSFESTASVRQLINAALSNARAIAVRQQTYAGARFQQNRDGSTYMIFIVHDKDATGDAYGFRAVTGRKPMKLPEKVTVQKSSVIFSPQGKLTIHGVQCLKGAVNDTIFNTQANVDNGSAMFVQDDDEADSVQSITILSKTGSPTTEHISPYTGELVMEYREQKP